jgi:hypothetical protein
MEKLQKSACPFKKRRKTSKKRFFKIRPFQKNFIKKGKVAPPLFF